MADVAVATHATAGPAEADHGHGTSTGISNSVGQLVRAGSIDSRLLSTR